MIFVFNVNSDIYVIKNSVIHHVCNIVQYDFMMSFKF